MKRLLILALALLWCSATWAVGISTLKGTVRCEGKGVANVVVTDGESFTTTDAKGRFALPSSDDNKLIYITVPAGYRVAAEQSVPQFWLKKEADKKSYDFALHRKAEDDTHHGFVVFADPQIWHQKEFPALREGPLGACVCALLPFKSQYGVCRRIRYSSLRYFRNSVKKTYSRRRCAKHRWTKGLCRFLQKALCS